MNIRVDLNTSIKDGTEVVFRSPVDCSQVTGLKVYYIGKDGNTTSQEFVLADAHGNNVGWISHLFAEDVAVKVILDVTKGMAFVQNADTNAYLEGRFDGLIEQLCPSFAESGSVVQCTPLEGYPLEVVSGIVPYMTGSGDPSPDNIRPITGHTSVTLTHCGKNLASTDILVGASGITETDGVFSGTVNSFHVATRNVSFVPAEVFKEGQQYVFSLYAKKGTAESSPYMVVKYTDGTQSGANITATGDFERYISVSDPGKTVEGVRLSYGSGGTDTLYIKDVQVEKGKTATAYESPREENTITLDLGQTVYGGSLDWKTGVLTVGYGIQDLSELEWFGPSVAYGNTVYLSEKFSAAASMIAGGRKGWCSVFNCLNGITLGTLPNNSLVYSIAEYSGDARIYIKADGVADVDALMAVLEGQKLVYQLAEPITIQLTPQEILALSGTNCLYSDTGDTEVAGKADTNAVIQDLYNKLNDLSATMTALTGV